MLTQSVQLDGRKQARLTSIPQKKEKRSRIVAREDAETIREALTLSASAYLAQFAESEVR